MRQSAVHAWPTRRASVGRRLSKNCEHVTRTLYVRRGRWSIDNNRGPVPARELGSCARPSRAAVLATPIGIERRRHAIHAMRYMRGPSKLTRPLPFAGGAARALRCGASFAAPAHLRAIACVAAAPCECACPSSPSRASRCSHGRRLCAALRLPCLISHQRAGQVPGQVPDRIVPPLPDTIWLRP